jgi:hypothetical protein
MKKKIDFLHPKSHRRFWYGSASGSVCQRYESEDPDSQPDPCQCVTDMENRLEQISILPKQLNI